MQPECMVVTRIQRLSKAISPVGRKELESILLSPMKHIAIPNGKLHLKNELDVGSLHCGYHVQELTEMQANLFSALQEMMRK